MGGNNYFVKYAKYTAYAVGGIAVATIPFALTACALTVGIKSYRNKEERNSYKKVRVRERDLEKTVRANL